MAIHKHKVQAYSQKVFAVFAALLLSVVLSFSGTFTSQSAFADNLDEACPLGGLHDFTVTIFEYATEDREGIRLFSCNKCGRQYEQTIPATGHAWGSWIVEVAPTCENEGYEYRVCQNYPSNPHYEERVMPALSASGTHSYVVVDRVESTCTEEGSLLYRCSVCGQTTSEVTPPSGHTWGDWYTETEPQVGKEGRSCRVCTKDPSHIEYESIPPLAAPVQHKKDDLTPLAPDTPADSNLFFTFEPNVVDAAVWSADLLLILVFVLLAIPFMFQVTWIKQKRSEASEKAWRQTAVKRSKE